MYERKKYGWTATGIVGMVFAPMGALFLIMGLLLGAFLTGGKPENRMIFLSVFGGLGVVFLLVGLALLLLDVRRRALLRRAYEGGYYVMGQIAGMVPQKNVHVNGRIPYVVECHVKDPSTGVVHVYYSRYLYINVKDLLQSDQVPVYLDRTDDRIGFVDIDAVLPEIRVHRG